MKLARSVMFAKHKSVMNPSSLFIIQWSQHYHTNFQHGTALECDYFEYTHTFNKKIKYSCYIKLNRQREIDTLNGIKTCMDKYKK